MPTTRDLASRVVLASKSIVTSISGTGTFLTTPGIDTINASAVLVVFSAVTIPTGSIDFVYQESNNQGTAGSYSAISSSHIVESSATTLTSGNAAGIRYATLHPQQRYVRVGFSAASAVTATGVTGTVICFSS